MMANKNENSFAHMYMEECKQANKRPLPMICVTLPHSIDFTTDRVKMDDWLPILNSLSLDRTLWSISVRSKYQHRKLLEDADSESKARAVGKSPVVLTRFVIERLSHSLNQCVRYSSTLTSLELEGIPVPPDCLAVLCVGLASTKTLQKLSLQRCYIGDAGCEIVSRTIADVHSIRVLNLAQCDLTSEAGTSLGSALSKQKLSLYHDAWKQSLRYREPKLESMPGLRRLTLNGNTKFGNQAITAIIDAIRDSLWFKALDLQQCGMTEDTCKSILELLDQNKTLAIVDVRLNKDLREDSLQEILRKLDRNNVGAKNEYQWLNLPNQKESTATGNKRVSSAGNLHHRPQSSTLEEKGRASSLTRPRSGMMVRQVKRPPPPVVFRKPLLQPAAPMLRRIKLKPPVPAFDRNPRQPMKPPERARQSEPETETAPKVSLHLDLQSHIQSLSDDQMNEELQLAVSRSQENLSRKESAVADESNGWPSESDAVKVEEVIRELLKIRAERDHLAEEMRRRELILAEERARREFTEAKFRSVKCDLAELEEILRQRDRDSQGYLLINQKSMEEICLSFARLLEMLEDTSSRLREDDDALSPQVSEEDIVKEDIKRRFALIIRKTKSENLKRGFYVDEDTVLSRFQMTARYGRSEANIRSAKRMEIEAPKRPMLQLERGRIGDTAENNRSLVRRLQQRQQQLQLQQQQQQLQLQQQQQEATHYEADKLGSAGSKSSEDSMSAGDRARAIFESFISGQSHNSQSNER